MTKVLFLYERDSKDVFAFFPNEMFDAVHSTSYSHIGQHSACHIDYVNECKRAKAKDYLALKLELETIGYKLEIL